MFLNELNTSDTTDKMTKNCFRMIHNITAMMGKGDKGTRSVFVTLPVLAPLMKEVKWNLFQNTRQPLGFYYIYFWRTNSILCTHTSSKPWSIDKIRTAQWFCLNGCAKKEMAIACVHTDSTQTQAHNKPEWQGSSGIKFTVKAEYFMRRVQPLCVGVLPSVNGDDFNERVLPDFG